MLLVWLGSFRPFRCRVPDRWSAAKSKASEWGAWVEVMFGMILVAELLLPRRSVRELKTPAVLRKLFTLKICKNLLKFVSLGLSYLVLSTFHHFIGIILKTLYSPAVVLTREFFFFF